MCFGYLDSGGDDEVSLRRNHDAYTQLEMHFQVCQAQEYGQPQLTLCIQVLAGLQPPLDLTTKLFGQEVGLPFFTCLFVFVFQIAVHTTAHLSSAAFSNGLINNRLLIKPV